MLRYIVIAFGLLASGGAMAQAVFQPGYVRRDGVFVDPHFRSAPDRSFNNNWSTSPNVNPYTGQRGSNAPTWNDRAPQRDNFGNWNRR